MKLKDIYPRQIVLASIKLPKNGYGAKDLVKARVVNRVKQQVTLEVLAPDQHLPVQTGDIYVGRQYVVHFSNVKQNYADYAVAIQREKLKRAKEREKQSAAWEAKRAEERARFEQGILPAFTGLPTVGYVGHGREDPDMAEYIRYMMLDGGSSTIQLREADLRAIAQRILELQQIVQQNAMVADDPPEAGHTPLTRMQVLEQELNARLKREADLQSEEG